MSENIFSACGFAATELSVDDGFVLSFKDSVVTIKGLSGVKANELIYFSGGATGVALNLEFSIVRGLVFGGPTSVRAGESVKRSGMVVSIGVGRKILGRVVDPLGRALDGLGSVEYEDFNRVERKAPGVIYREQISQPLETGLNIIDALVPIGRGQRELILGDRKTGKTMLAIDSMLNQVNARFSFEDPVFSVYVAIGKRMAEVARLIKLFRKRKALKYVVFMVARASDAASLQFLAPYSACTLAEYFTYSGLDTLVIFDDLSRHADAYRQISLLLRRPVGREAFPGDIFYLHSRLLERAVKLSVSRRGGGTMTALPIIETIQGDVSAYIPTNVISITDGQIYLDLERHQGGTRPAVNPGLSVSRVGSTAQALFIKRLSKSLKLELALYDEVSQFAKFGSELDQAAKATLIRGHLRNLVFIQKHNFPFANYYKLIRILLSSTDVFKQIAMDVTTFRLSHYWTSLDVFIKYCVLFDPFKIGIAEEGYSIRDTLLSLIAVHYKYYLFKFFSDSRAWYFQPKLVAKEDFLVEFSPYFLELVEFCSDANFCEEIGDCTEYLS